MMRRVAVIGAGAAGLAAAARLAGAGLDVTVWEQNESVGGKAGELRRDGFRFDTGPSLLTMGFTVDRLFADLGENRADHVTFRPLDVLCRYHYPNGTVLRSVPEISAFAAAVAVATGDDVRAVKRYFAHSADVYRLAEDFYLFRTFDGWADFARDIPPARGLAALRKLPQLGMHRSMHSLHCRFFRDSRTIQLFDRYATYTGSNPYTCPATFALIPHVEHQGGAALVEGGIYRLIEALRDLALRQGAQLHTQAPVRRILVREGRIIGLEAAGEQYEYDAVISAVDVGMTYDVLLADAPCPTARRHRRRPLSTSALIFHLGVRGRHADLDVHNIFFSGDYKSECRTIHRQQRCYAEPTIYLYISSRFAPADAPPGHENWFVMINTPPDLGQNWAAETQRAREYIRGRLKQATGVDLADAVVSESVMTPPDLARRTGSLFGSIYGPAAHGFAAALMRQPNRSRDFRGLYFCGGSAHPGGGLPLALISGELAARQVLNEGDKE